jgi:hypothetical protein
MQQQQQGISNESLQVQPYILARANMEEEERRKEYRTAAHAGADGRGALPDAAARVQDRAQTSEELAAALQNFATPAAGRGSTQVTAIVQHNHVQPSSQYEYADRIATDITMVREPHLLISLVHTLQARVAQVRLERTTSARGIWS